MRQILTEWDDEPTVTSLERYVRAGDIVPVVSSRIRCSAALGVGLALAMAGCGSDERTVETIPIPLSVESCLDELQAADEPETLFGTTAENIRLCIVLQGLDCILNEPLCTSGPECSAPAWSCSNPGLELEDGDILDAHLFIVEDQDSAMACTEVAIGESPTCAGPSCLARIDYELEYVADDAAALQVTSTPVQISHSGFLSEEVGTFTSSPQSICSAIEQFSCEGEGCEAPTRIDLTVGGVGSGRIDVVSDAQTFACPEPESTSSRCVFFLPSGRGVTLTATAAAGSVFGDWGDACASEGRAESCSLSPVGETIVTARFGHRLTIEVVGQGAVLSSDGGVDGDGVNCASDVAGTTCTEDYVTERRVELIAQGSPEWPFGGWVGCDDPSGNTCAVTMSEARNVRAVFGRQVVIEVVGGGAVTVSPGDEVCTGSCTYAFSPGETVTLTAAANPGSTRYDWQLDCAAEATETCSLGALERNVSVAARFGYEVTTTFDAERGNVMVTEGDPSVECDTSAAGCRAYLPGTALTLVATGLQTPVFAFTGWGGLCQSAAASATCNLSVGEPGPVTAAFERAVQVGIQLDNRGQAAGTVTSVPPPNAANCPLDCSDRYLQSAGTVELSAEAPAGTRFEGWDRVGGGAACTGGDTNPVCEVDISDGVDRVVQARFVSEQLVTVNLTGEGTGTVAPVATPPSPNWSCNATRCTGDFAFGQTVSFETTTSGINHLELFRSSEGTCNGGTTCSVTIGAVDLTIEAEFEVERDLELTIVNGAAGGSVELPASFNTASPLTCTANCSRTYLSGQVLTLVAAAPVNVAFGGWNGTCDTVIGGIACQVEMNADPRQVTATFEAPRQLDIRIVGTGAGEVIVEGGINQDRCSGTAPFTCPTLNYPVNTALTLSVAPAQFNDFGGWGGDCAGQGATCSLQMSVDRSVEATFNRQQHDLTINFAGAAAAQGRVTWLQPTGPADCTGPASCTETIDAQASVRVQAVSGAGFAFTQWTNCPTPNGDVCEISPFTADRALTATFVPIDDVDVSLTGSGTGRVVWVDPARSTCELAAPGACPTEAFLEGTAVELRAEPANADTEFLDWTNCPDQTANVCELTVSDALPALSAEFVALHDVTIVLAGDGNGRIDWTDPVFPDCVPGTCPPRQVRQGTTVTLEAQPVAGSTFTGWTGCTSTSGTNSEICTLSNVSSDVTPTASYFDDRTVTIEVQGSGDAGLDFLVSGVVVDSCAVTPIPPNYSCSKTFAYTDSPVVVRGTTGAGTTFDGFGGALGCTGPADCSVDIQTAASHSGTASFSN